jgi:hypothetical protein
MGRLVIEFPGERLGKEGILTVSMGNSEISTRLHELRQEHRDLDDAISQMAGNPATDQLKLRRLKKRKLRLRDQIAYWESKLIPDLDA